jgi:hypothetical protein
MGSATVLYTELVVTEKGLCLQFSNLLLVTVLKFVFCLLLLVVVVVVVIRARSQGSGCTAAIRLIVHPVL